MAKTRFRSFDGGYTTQALRCNPGDLTLKSFSELEEKTLAGKQSRIACGAGLSFAAAGFGHHSTSVDLSSFRQILDYDEVSGVVEVQAGATMGDIYNFLIGHNRYLVTQPGYPSITAGGCIAVDIHGKNQLRDGNFSDHVESLKLSHPAYGVIEVSPRFNREIFELTMGGYGLTGHILSARVRTKALPSNFMELRAQPVEAFADTAALMQTAASQADFTISWHDLSMPATSKLAFGKGFVLSGSFGGELSQGRAPKLRHTKYIDSRSCDGLGFNMYSLPFTRLMNVLYGGLKRMRTEPAVVPVHECLYPSKALRDVYYKLFGPDGFHESQLIVPVERFADFIEAIRLWLAAHDLPMTLASAKFFGGSQRLLRYAGPGVCFALNFPRCENSAEFMRYLDGLCLEMGLVPYIVKDSRLPRAVVEGCYKDYEQFKSRLRQYDRDRLFNSELSERLGL